LSVEVKVERQSEGVVVFVVGEVNNEDVDFFREQISTAYIDGSGSFIIDVSGLKYVNSAGVGALAALQRRLRKHGDNLVIRDPQPAIERLLRVTRLDTVITVEWSDQ